MVDGISKIMGENGVFLRKINENEVVLEKKTEFGCKKCDIF